ncbi:hypothetical protein N657DRAFT_243632 [Parathielavia appendiculata]|uniref:Uncharacterized protein n=1 Tax=Parathielavia appendiculata TaxID=2587402 RepID=A0AAN6TSH3_9PEZI|nr:hypothetical protein N657DRAFT_243632 [Parathielavia appendiculata]
MTFIHQVVVIISVRRHSSTRGEGFPFTAASPTCAGPLRTPTRQEHTVSSVVCAILASWFGSTPRTSIALKPRLASRPMCERARDIEIVSPKRPGGNAFTESAINDEVKTIAEASNVFFSTDLSIVFDVLTVRALSAGTRLAESWRLLRARRFLAQAALSSPTTDRQKGNAQLQ